MHRSASSVNADAKENIAAHFNLNEKKRTLPPTLT
jgi:hypothetical protein